MVIDFHVHCFPDKLAERAVSGLAEIANLKNASSGTAADLIEKMDQWKIDHAVVLNIATNPKQQRNVNDFAIETNRLYKGRLTALGSIHPDSDESVIEEEMRRLSDAGIPGLKLHPDYMRTVFDDAKFKPILKLCCEYGMFVTIHAGFDLISPDLIHAPPEVILKVISEFPELKLIAAHMGGNEMWDDVERLLVGENVYFDTSLACVFGLDRRQAERMILNHDPTRILFGSDCPWCGGDASFDYLNSLEISAEVKSMILHGNAERLLGV